MPAGRKPRFSLKGNKRDAPREKGAKREYVNIGAAWPNDYGSFNFSFPKGTKIKFAEGEIVDTDKFFFSLFENKPDESSEFRAPKAEVDEFGDPVGNKKRDDFGPLASVHGDDDMPF